MTYLTLRIVYGTSSSSSYLNVREVWAKPTRALSDILIRSFLKIEFSKNELINLKWQPECSSFVEYREMRLQVKYVIMMALKNPADFQKMSFVVWHDYSHLKDGKLNLFFFSFLTLYLFLPQDWFAFTGNGSLLNFTITGKEYFANSGNPSAQNNYGFCQVKTT